MKRQNIFNVLTLLSTCASLVACSKDNSPNAKLFWAYSTENLMADWDYLDASTEYFAEENAPYLERDYTLRYDCLKGENEGAQLMISANRFINHFDFELPTLSNGVDTIDSSNFSVAAAWYQDIDGSIEIDAYSGAYPDALIPLSNYKWRRMDHIEKGRNQALYINFLSTTDMKPGKYVGEGKLTLDDQTYSIPFEVKIYNAEMPVEVHQDSCYLIWYDQISIGEKNNATPDVERMYYDFIVNKRIAPDSLPGIYESDAETFADTMYEIVANNPRISKYRMPFAGTEFVKSEVKEYLKALVDKNIALRKAGDNETDLLRKLMFYVDDEPNRDRYDLVRGHDKAIYEIKCELAPLLKDYPDLRKSLFGIENLVTVEYGDNLVATPEQGGVQTWCPQFPNFNSKKQRAIYQARQESNLREGGEEVWWYGCIDPKSPYVSYHLDADLLNSRILRYMQYNYGIQGNIYWCVNYASKYQQGFASSRDYWYDSISWSNCAGDGYLTYPGVDFGIKGPITTLRLESILAGNEEYEYLWMIEQKVKEYNELHDTNHDVNQLLQKYMTRLFTDVIAIDDDDVFNEVRLELLKVTETINNNLTQGMSLLLQGNKAN